MPPSPNPGKRVILVGIGGASCSGKTTLAKHLRNALPGSVIIHQDDFAPPMELVPIHPTHGVQDWDSAPGAIEWPRLAAFLQRVKETGEIPPDHRSHDHLNAQKEVPVPEEALERWKAAFLEKAELADEKIVYGLVDGFLLYWCKDVLDQLDLRIFLRTPADVLKQRRDKRDGYYTAVQSDPIEGVMWQDPPSYWDDIVYPAYVDAHRDLFEDGDVENGKLNKSGEEMKLEMVEGLKVPMVDIIERCCRLLLAEMEKK